MEILALGKSNFFLQNVQAKESDLPGQNKEFL